MFQFLNAFFLSFNTSIFCVFKTVKKVIRLQRYIDFSLAGCNFSAVFKRFETQKSHGFKTLELQSFDTSTMPQYSF